MAAQQDLRHLVEQYLVNEAALKLGGFDVKASRALRGAQPPVQIAVLHRTHVAVRSDRKMQSCCGRVDTRVARRATSP